MKTKPKVAKKAKAPKAKKPLTVPSRTVTSAAFIKLKWKPKPVRVPGKCSRLGCNKTGVKGLFCKKDKKTLRKLQLKLNNIPWRKKKAKPNYVPDQPHVVYGKKATQFTLKNKDKAVKRVKAGLSVLENVKDLEKAIAAVGATKVKVAAPKVKKEAKPKAKWKKPAVKSVKVKTKVKAKKAKAPKEIDLTEDDEAAFDEEPEAAFDEAEDFDEAG